MAAQDLDLNRDDEPRLGLPRGDDSRAKWAVGGAIVLVLALGGLAWWWTRDRAPAAAPAVASTSPGTEVALPPPVVLPPMDQMDAFLRVLLGTLSTRPELSKWLATDNLLGQMAHVIDRIASGATPARDLKVLAPEKAIEIGRSGRARTIDPVSYQRYDGLAETIGGLDPSTVVRNYETIKPRLNEAYRGLGRSEGDVQPALVAALDVLIATPVPDGPITVVEGKGATWVFADPALEALDPAQKQLLRMGPANARRVIATLQSVRRQIQP